MILLSVKHSGALSTFLTLKAVYPLSSVLFAYINWPLLGRTLVNMFTGCSIVIVLPSIVLFQYATQRQDHMAQKCCFPLFGLAKPCMEREGHGEVGTRPLANIPHAPNSEGVPLVAPFFHRDDTTGDEQDHP